MFKILFNPKYAIKHPITMMFVGIFYSSLSILLSFYIFPEYASLVMVFLTVFSCLYVVQGIMRIEESKEGNYKTEFWLLGEHLKIVYFFLFLFLGFVISFSLWTLFLGPEKVSILFGLQSSVVEGAKAVSVTGNAFSSESFFVILFNNLKVVGISLVLAFFYGAGAIFVMVWNASVMGYVIGILARNSFGLVSLPAAFAKYFLHGIPEMLAYIVIALVGGIIYSSSVKKDFLEQGRAKKILVDVCVLGLISIALLVFAAFLEVYVTPLI